MTDEFRSLGSVAYTVSAIVKRVIMGKTAEMQSKHSKSRNSRSIDHKG